jgi:hypothetical protein
MIHPRTSRVLLPGLLFAFTALLSARAPAAEKKAQQPDYRGTWVMNPAESLGLRDPDRAEVVVLRRQDDVLDYTWTGTPPNGEKQTFSYSGPVDGKVHELPGNTGLRGAFIPTPSGVVESKLWLGDVLLEDKFCIMSAPRVMTCFATATDEAGKVYLFKEVFDQKK